MINVENEGIYKSLAGGRIRLLPNIETSKTYGLDESVCCFCSATVEFAMSDEQYDKQKRAEVLEFSKDVQSHHEKITMMHNARGLRNLEAAMISAEKAFKAYDSEKEKSMISHGDFMAGLDEREVVYKENLLNAELQPDEIKHLRDEYSKARKILDAEGRRGLIKELHNKYGELKKVSLNTVKRREHASIAIFCQILLGILVVIFIIEGIMYICS